MDVAIVRCPDTYQYNDIDVHEEILAGYAAAVLEQAGYTCKVFDLKLHKTLDPTTVLSSTPKVIAIPVRHPGDTLFYARKFVRELINLRVNLPHITLFGHANVAVEENLRKFRFDTIITGEEQELVGLVAAIINGRDYRGLPGIAFLKEDGSLQRNRPSLPQSLDDLPEPKRYYLDELRDAGRSDPRVTVTLQTSRGCYAACSFCFLESEKLARGGKYPWRARALPQVIAEIKNVIRKYGVHHFYFYDTDFFGPGRRNRTRGEEFARMVIEEGLDISFHLYTRATDLTEESITAMKDAGLNSVFIGIESFSQAVLRRYNKATTVAQNFAAIELCKKYDIYIQTGYITYDYYTTFDELLETVAGWQRVLSSKPYLLPTPVFLFTFIAPLDGTPIADHYREHQILDPKARYSFPSWLIPDLRMKSPTAPYTFRDTRVAELAECTRLLSYELAKKVVVVHKALDAALAECSSDEELEAHPMIERLVEWLSNLSLFALETFAEAVQSFQAGINIYVGIENMYGACLGFYKQYLPPELCTLETYIRHYQKLRKRAAGYVEDEWEGLLAKSTT